MNETRDRILDVALDVLGENPDAGMGDIASAAARNPSPDPGPVKGLTSEQVPTHDHETAR
jgi:hypothetical protein